MKKIPTDLDEGTIRRVDWLELIPAVLLPHAFRIAIGFRALWISTFGVLLSVLMIFLLNGISGRLVSQENTDAAYVPYLLDFEPWTARSNLADHSPNNAFRVQSLSVPKTVGEATEPILAPWKMLTDTATQVLPKKKTNLENGIAVIWFLWSLGLWILIGGTITRTAALQLTLGIHERMSGIQRFLNGKWKSYGLAIFLPLLGMGCCWIAVLFAKLLYSVVVLNYLVALFFPLVLLAGFLFAVLGIGLLFGWPLMFAAVSVDGSDGFDAVSRAYSYVYQRPLHYLFYAVCAIVIGAVGWYFFVWFLDCTFALVVSWGGFSPVDFADLQRSGGKVLENMSIPQRCISFWCWCFQWLKVGFLFGYFWCATTAIYLILRRSVDGTPFDSVLLLEEPKIRTLTPIKPDAKGAPEMQKNDEKHAE